MIYFTSLCKKNLFHRWLRQAQPPAKKIPADSCGDFFYIEIWTIFVILGGMIGRLSNEPTDSHYHHQTNERTSVLLRQS